MKDLDQRVFSAYFRHFGKSASQPNQNIDWYQVEDRDYACLSNSRQLLACYRILPDGYVRFVANPPQEILANY